MFVNFYISFSILVSVELIPLKFHSIEKNIQGNLLMRSENNIAYVSEFVSE